MARRTGPDAPKSLDELLAIVGVDRDVATAAILAGELPGYKVGRRWVIPAAAFEDFRHGRWIPRPRPILAQPQPLPEPTDFIRRKGA